MGCQFVCFGSYNMNNNLLYIGIKITKGSVKNSNRVTVLKYFLQSIQNGEGE